MLKDRGYNVVGEEIFFIDEFRSRFGQQPDLVNLGLRVSHLTDPSNTLQVVFAKIGDVKVGDVHNIYNFQIGNKESLKRLILIVSGKVFKNAEKVMAGWNYKYQILHLNDLNLFATMNDFKWNQYDLLPYDQKVVLLNQYKSEGKELSPMPKTDIVARFYGLEEGQVLSIFDSRVITATDFDGLSFRLIV